jgi:DNA-binding MurR/RpiR family transcriptional regulator
MSQSPDKTEFLEKIKRITSQLAGKQVKIGDYLFHYYDKSAFMTINQLAAEAGASETTIMRFVVSLGYSGYSEFLSDLQKIVMQELTSGRSRDHAINSEGGEDLFHQVLQKEKENISDAITKTTNDEFKALVDIILRSQRIWVLGTRASACLAHYLSFQLGKIRQQVFPPVTHGGTASFDCIKEANTSDLLIAIAFPRYPRETFDLVNFALVRKMRVAGITDRVASPLTKLCNPCLFVPVELLNFVDLFSAQLAWLAALVSTVADRDKSKTVSLLEGFEEYAKQVKLFLGSQT